MFSTLNGIIILENTVHIQEKAIANALKGNHTAMEYLYNQFSKAMYNVCIRMAGNRTDAEDILQESFLIAFDKLHQLKEAAQFGGWLKRIVVNECIKYSKKNFYWDDWNEDWNDTMKEEDIAWMGAIEMKQIQEAIKNLPDGCRQVFNLFVLEDFSHKEIGNSLGISEGTSKSQYFRAKNILKDKLTKQLFNNG